MRILIAPDKFKDSLGAAEAAEEIASGLRSVWPEAEITSMPLADGGEGTASVICRAMNGEWRDCAVHDPLGAMVDAHYCLSESGATAVMEMSAAAGLSRVPPERRDPLAASTFGVGEMLRHAAARGVKQIIIGLGGSATNDGGFGMARALGFKFLNAAGAELKSKVSELRQLAAVCRAENFSLPKIIAAADVRNPLLGLRGATRVFGRQKGADAEQMEILESALTRLADVVARDLKIDAREFPRAGAAGGLGFGLTSFCAAELRAGFELVAETIGLEQAIRAADLVITGEGRFDEQTLEGKAPAGVARLARKHGKRVGLIAGSIEGNVEARAWFDAVHALAEAPISVAEAIANAPALLRRRAYELARALESAAPLRRTFPPKS